MFVLTDGKIDICGRWEHIITMRRTCKIGTMVTGESGYGNKRGTGNTGKMRRLASAVYARRSEEI